LIVVYRGLDLEGKLIIIKLNLYDSNSEKNTTKEFSFEDKN
jgi:hypothetical protein